MTKPGRIEQAASVDSLEWAHPIVREWFLSKFGSPTEPQQFGWPHILARQAVLISAPTGSGKTLAAFLACIDKLVRKAINGELKDRTEVVYVSPLKALSNDIQKNLDGPLHEISELAKSRGIAMTPIRTAVRTGDTLQSERRAMLKYPPHILVTTPESLYILLTAVKSRATLTTVETLIVDEIHAVADDKRGAHLALSLERLERLCQTPPARIGLSATQKPIETVAHFLAGNGRPLPVIVNVGHRRQMDLAIEVPGLPLGAVASNDQWEDSYDRLAQLIREHRSTLIFVNTRKMAERLTLHLAERLGENAVATHHGSLSRKLRLQAERRLKAGEIQALVATASLELGIDIGSIDLVCLVSSPRSIAVGLQRIGRAGHWRGAIPKGRIFPTTRDELLECAALVKSINDGELDQILIPDAPLDVLAQQIVAMSTNEDWHEDELFSTVKRAGPYKTLEREQFCALLEMLSDGISARRGRYGAFIVRDQVNGVVRARRGARLAAITSGGAIPDTAMYTVVADPDQSVIGTLSEDFAIECNIGDIILLGNTSWKIRRIESAGRVLVQDAHGASPTVPFWLGEAPARTQELSAQVASLRQTVSDMLPDMQPLMIQQSNQEVAGVIRLLQKEYGVDAAAAEQIIQYILEGRAVLSAVPTQKTIIAERFFDEGGGMQLVIHAPFGGRINKAWGMALRKRFCKSFNFELQAAATDDGLNISLADNNSFPLADVFNFLHPETVEQVLVQASLQSPIFATRFRWDAMRALALLRFTGGKKVPPMIQRMRADDLLAAVFPDAAACQDNIQGDVEVPDHPLLNEVMKDVLTEAMDLEGLKQLLQDIYDGEIHCISVDTSVPSQFSHEILNANPYAYLDDAPLEERRARAVNMRRILPESMSEISLLEPAAIAQVSREAWPDVRDRDELHDVLQTLIMVPEDVVGKRNLFDKWNEFFAQLAAENRAAVTCVGERRYWVCAEKQKAFNALFPTCIYQSPLPELKLPQVSFDDAMVAALCGWMADLGPYTAPELSQLLGLELKDVELALIRLESDGSILRGHFRSNADVLEWCERRLLARIHKMTVSSLRKQVEAVTAAQFMSWLPHWQHMAPGSQLAGERGLLEVIKQLQGFEIPANAWESQILARRVAKYDPAMLDKLCLQGAVGWGRLSPHPATLEIVTEGDTRKERRVIPTSVAPITFFVREDSDWMVQKHPDGASEEDNRGLGFSARQVKDFLRLRGASFFADIVRGVNMLKSDVETALWELVAAGLVTADGFDNLRSLIDPKRRTGHGSGRYARPRHSTGRWSLLHAHEVERTRLVEATCWVLLKRYGVVMRDLMARETFVPKWRELLSGFRRLEDRGEVRGGRFVSGFVGEQFALPEAVESVRAMRRKQGEEKTLTVCAADPLNLVGIIIPGEKIAAVSTKTVTFKGGIMFGTGEENNVPEIKHMVEIG